MMKELELKYGCNPNQKPSKNLYEEWKRSSDSGVERTDRDISISWMHLTDGSLVSELEESNRTSGCNII